MHPHSLARTFAVRSHEMKDLQPKNRGSILAEEFIMSARALHLFLYDKTMLFKF